MELIIEGLKTLLRRCVQIRLHFKMQFLCLYRKGPIPSIHQVSSNTNIILLFIRIYEHYVMQIPECSF